MTHLQQIKIQKAITEMNKLTADELEVLIKAIKAKRDQLHSMNAQSFKAGDKVQFTSSRSGRLYTGSVSRVKIKYVVVNCDNGQVWNIPGSMLRPQAAQ